MLDWFKAWALLCVGPVLALLLAQLGLSRNTDYWQWLDARPGDSIYAEWKLASPEARRQQLVVLGSSVAVWDFDEAYFSTLTDTSQVLNLGIHGAPLVDIAMRIDDVLDLQPQHILLVLAPPNLGSVETLENVRAYHPLVALRLFTLDALFADWTTHLARGVADFNILYRHRQEIQERLQGKRPRSGPWNPRERGSVSPDVVKERLAIRHQKDRESPVTGEGPNVEALRYLCAQTRARSVPLSVVMAPLHPQAYSPALDRATPLLRALSESLQFDLIPEVNRTQYPLRYFRDPVHLMPEGQRKFTEYVARQLSLN